jgi:hypothetical protein
LQVQISQLLSALVWQWAWKVTKRIRPGGLMGSRHCSMSFALVWRKVLRQTHWLHELILRLAMELVTQLRKLWVSSIGLLVLRGMISLDIGCLHKVSLCLRMQLCAYSSANSNRVVNICSSFVNCAEETKCVLVADWWNQLCIFFLCHGD